MPARPFSHRSLYSFAASFWRGWLGSRSVAAVLQPGNFGDQSASPRSRCAGSLRTGYGRDEANLRNYNYSKVFGMAVQVTPTMANVDMQELSMAAESAVGQGKLLDSIDPEPSPQASAALGFLGLVHMSRKLSCNVHCRTHDADAAFLHATRRHGRYCTSPEQGWGDLGRVPRVRGPDLDILQEAKVAMLFWFESSMTFCAVGGRGPPNALFYSISSFTKLSERQQTSVFCMFVACAQNGQVGFRVYTSQRQNRVNS